MDHSSFDLSLLEKKIRYSHWWQKAANTIDNHHSNNSGVMLTHHLEAVYNNVEDIFNRPETGFYAAMFHLCRQLKLEKEQVKKELKIIALLHDIGKPEEDKLQVIAHPITGKPAHMRHGIVGLIASMEVIGADLLHFPQQQNSIYRMVELHDISFGLYREYLQNGSMPQTERLRYISSKIHLIPGAGLLYLLLFKLADIHGHDNIGDVFWFYKVAGENYFSLQGVDLPMPGESDIR